MQNETELQLEFNFGTRALRPETAHVRATLTLARRVGHCRVVSRGSLAVHSYVRDYQGRRVVAVFRPTRNVLKRAFQRGILAAKGSCPL